MKSIQQGLSDLRPEYLKTAGVRTNARAIFSIRFSGTDVYDLLKLLEGVATQSPNSYLEVRKCVFLSEKIRNQTRRQGF